MMKKIYSLLFAVLLGFSLGVSAQQSKPVGPFSVTTAATVTQMPSIQSRSKLIPSVDKEIKVQDGRATRNEILIGKGSKGADALAQSKHRTSGTVPGRTPSLVIETALSTSRPTDPSGAVGPDHYFAVFNTGFRIFDKSGSPLTEQLNILNIFPENNQCCDLTISYDNLADRWIATILSFTNGIQIAISNGPNPVTSSWTIYNFPNVSDYNKLSVWRDGYYVTENTGGSTKLWVLERSYNFDGSPDAEARMAGFELPGIVINGFHSPQALNITNDNHPTTGGCPIVYLQDDAWNGVDTDHIKLWEATMDWDNVENSTVSDPLEIAVTEFTSVFDGGDFANLTQPNGGQDIDALQATIMNQAQFRKFDGHNSGVFNFVVDTDISGQELAGIRWIELRQDVDGGTWSLFQEGTYTAPDGKHAWHGSMAMDSEGNIGLGYTSMAGPTTPTDGSVDLVLSSYYTGRFASDAPGTMSIEETLIAKGSGNIPGGERYGDYGKMDVNPITDKEFWFLNEYVGANGRANVLGVFQLAPELTNDVAVTSIDNPVNGNLGNSEVVTITIYNLGSADASNFDVTYQVDGGAIVTETFTGTIPPSSSMQYTFTTTADFSIQEQSYQLTAATNYSIDEDNSNDATTRTILNVTPLDIGVVDIVSPSTGDNLGVETVTVTIKNFGSVSQTGFDVSYTLDGGTAITETVTATVDPLEEIDFNFITGVDVSEIADYTISAFTTLNGDTDSSNDTASSTFSNLSCLTTVNTTTQEIGPDADAITESVITVTNDFIITDVNVLIDVTHTYNQDLVIELIAPDGTTVELANRVGGNEDNFTNTLFDSESDNPIQNGAAPFTGVFAPSGSLEVLNGLTSAGEWTLRITDNVNEDGGSLNNWSIQLCAAEALSVPNPFLEETDLVVVSKGKNQFNVTLNTTEFNQRLDLNVYNLLGQRMLNHRLFNTGSGYYYDLDMSYAAKGVYLVKVGTGDVGKVKRIIVK